MYNISDTYYATSISSAFWNPAKAIVCANASTCWSQSAAYLNGPFQTGVDVAVGAGKSVTTTHIVYTYNCCAECVTPPTVESSQPINALDIEPCWTSVTTSFTTWVPLPFDGLVTQESAWSLPGVGTSIYKAEHVKHEQLKNSTQMEALFKLIFDGKNKASDGSTFFKTANKP
jgi:hypothetical protein